MKIRDRVVRFCRVLASELEPHPENWRTHCPAQRDALQVLLGTLGFAGAVLARELADGRLQLLDGHLRAAALGDQLLPVLVVDLDEQEARQLLLTYDSLSALGGVAADRLERLLADAPPLPASLAGWLEERAGSQGADAGLLDTSAETGQLFANAAREGRFATIPELFQVVVDCRSEAEQEQVYAQLKREGWSCRVLTL